jgi:hypothetical protein
VLVHYADDLLAICKTKQEADSAIEALSLSSLEPRAARERCGDNRRSPGCALPASAACSA